LKTAHDDWLLWQLADSAFPTGGFAHSGGLEAAWQHGEVRNITELTSFLKASISQLSHGALPFVNGAHNAPQETPELDRLCDAFLSNHVANRASRVQGQSLLVVAERAFGLARPPLPFAHTAPVFGCVARRLELTAAGTAHLFLYQNVRGLIAAAIRLGIIGPMEAQALQHGLAPGARETADLGESLPFAEPNQTAPLLDLWQASQDRLYSRLFQS
jgi:urease accessory protein